MLSAKDNLLAHESSRRIYKDKYMDIALLFLTAIITIMAEFDDFDGRWSVLRGAAIDANGLIRANVS